MLKAAQGLAKIAGAAAVKPVEVSKRGALYQRYSDDILIACPPSRGAVLKALVEEKLIEHGLELQSAKTDIVTLHGPSCALNCQYLGYQLGYADARLRLKSLSRQWRSAKRAVKKTERVGLAAIKAGKATQIFTRKLHMRFTAAGTKNFLAYAKRSADALDSPAIRQQAGRLNRCMSRELPRIKGKPTPKP